MHRYTARHCVSTDDAESVLRLLPSLIEPWLNIPPPPVHLNESYDSPLPSLLRASAAGSRPVSRQGLCIDRFMSSDGKPAKRGPHHDNQVELNLLS